MKLRKYRNAAVVLSICGILSLTACVDYDDGGVTGRVVEKDQDSHMVGKTTTWDYELSIVDSNGKEHEIEVSSDTYDNCYRGSHYPTCKNR